MARASIHLMNLDKKTYSEQVASMSSHINVGSGQDLTIKDLAETIKEVVGFKGAIHFNTTKPDGPLRKFLDSKRINNFGFKPAVSLKDGLAKTYQDYSKS
jgi:GDP-L-fucose synthase